MPGTATDTGEMNSQVSLSDFLNMLDLRGQTWCIVEIHGSGGFSLPPHDGVVFYGGLQGNARIVGNSGITEEISAGEVQILLSGEAHAVRTRSDSPARTLAFLRDEQVVDQPPTLVVGDSGPVTARILCGRLRVTLPAGLKRVAIPPIVGLEPASLGSATSSLRAESFQIMSKGSGASAILTRIAALFLATSLRQHPQFPLLFRLSASRNPIAHALDIIGSNPAANWSVSDLARRVGMGRSNFAARFLEEVGQTPMHVITERRMQRAASLLQESELKIVQISTMVGYQSEAAFSRRFTRFFGVSPGRMRVGRRERRRPASAAEDRRSGIASADRQYLQ